MAVAIHLTVNVKDDSKLLKKDFLIYESIFLDEEDPIINKCVKETLDEFKGEPEDIKVKALMILR